MNASLVLIAVSTAILAARPTKPPVLPFESSGNPTSQSRIDVLVFHKLKQLGIPPPPICSDAVFVRRVYLDTIGTLPIAGETREFLADKNPEKRRLLIDRLLERKEFADYWAMRWCDLLRVKSEYPINLWPNAVQAYHHWIRAGIRDNCRTTVSYVKCSRPAAAISTCPRSTSTAPCRAGNRRPSPKPWR